MTLTQARRLGIRWLRAPAWPPGTFLELVQPQEVPTPPPPLETAWPTAVVLFRNWRPYDRLYWRLPWENYQPLELHGED